MATPSKQQRADGQKIYTPFTLAFYNFVVLFFSNQFIWRCSSKKILEFYNKHISKNHLDVGVGSGWFLNHCTFPSETPQLALLDLNPHCLKYAAQLLQRYHPKIYQADFFYL